MKQITLRKAAALAAMLLAAACKDNTGPKSGQVLVSLTGTPAPRSVRFRLVGKQTGITVLNGSAMRVFTSAPVGDTISVAVIAPAGQTLGIAMVQVTVPDVAAAVSSYKAAIIQVAAPNYTLLNPTAYTVVIQSSIND